MWLNWLLLGLLLVAIFLLSRQVQRTREAEQDLLNKQIPRDTLNQMALLQQQLATTHESIVVLIEAVPDPILFIDLQHRIITHNAAAKKLLSTCEVGKTLMEVARSYELDSLAAEAIAGDRVERELTLNSRLFRSMAGTLAGGAVLVLRDVSELQRLGRARRDFVANISHELRTPLTAIRLLLDTLRRSGSQITLQQEQTLSRISDQTDTLTQLAQEVYDLSLIESGQLPMRMVRASVYEMAADVLSRLQPQAERAGLYLVNAVDIETRALFDETQIQRVLSNLVHNAIKFTEKGTVSVFVVERDAVTGAPAIHLHPPAPLDLDDRLLIGVSDTGTGIPTDELPRIFERFYKVDRARGQSGTGLGLAIAKHIIEAHGGVIWAESTLGKGTTFYLTVPKEV